MGRLLAIGTRRATKVPMDLHEACAVTPEQGVGADFRGRPSARQVTVLAKEAWAAACAELGTELPWTTRRANLLVEGIELAHSTGRRLRIGGALLEVTGETDPCRVMDLQHAGLRAVLAPDWRGGASCRVVGGGPVAVGDPVAWEAGEGAP